jgi:hypothetical protein
VSAYWGVNWVNREEIGYFKKKLTYKNAAKHKK